MSQSDQQTVTITLNGATRRLAGRPTVAELLDELGIDRRHVAVERNRALVPRSEHATTRLADGDVLEVVTFVGGG